MASQTTREKEKLIIGLYKQHKKPQEVATLVGVSKRTVERKIKAYENGEMPYCDNIVKKVSQFEKEAEIELLDILKSESYTDIIKFSLEKITPERVDAELDKGGIRGVVTLVGTLIDKRLKSYTLEVERENVQLKKDIAQNSRQIVFMNEGELYESSNELPTRHIKDIS